MTEGAHVVPAVAVPAHPVETVVGAVTEPPAEAVRTLEEIINEKLDAISGMLTIHGEHLQRSHEATERVLGHLSNVANSLTETSGHIAEAAAHVAGESAQTVLTVPEIPAEVADEAAEGGEEVVEKVTPEAAKPKKKSGKDFLKRRK